MGNFNGYGMWGGGWGELPQQYAPQERQMPQTGGQGQATQIHGDIPMHYGVGMQGGQGFAPPQMPFQPTPVARGVTMAAPQEPYMHAPRFPGNDRESRMNRFGSYAQRFAL